ncbi:hypothetical protein HDV01_001631 [Terramyces sp. JEL0728]|nr:hypothetical protein HDV01_001631 [Terramyces sp. JEL0728]
MKPFRDNSQIPKPRDITEEKKPNFVITLNRKIKELDQLKIEGYKERKKDFQDVIEWLQNGNDDSKEKLAQNSKQELQRRMNFSESKDYNKLANEFQEKLDQEQQKFQLEKQRGQERLLQLEQTFKLQLQDLHKKSIQERKSKLFEENHILKEKLKGFLLEIDLQQKSFKSTLKRQHKEYELALAKSELHKQESTKAKQQYQENKEVFLANIEIGQLYKDRARIAKAAISLRRKIQTG